MRPVVVEKLFGVYMLPTMMDFASVVATGPQSGQINDRVTV